jgi:hypothetical protein
MKDRIRQCGSIIGSSKCVYADEFSLGVLATALQTILLIYNADGRDEVSSSRKRSRSSADSSACFLKILPGQQALGEVGLSCLGANVVILTRTRREHYNLIEYKGKRVANRLADLPSKISELWNLT